MILECILIQEPELWVPIQPIFKAKTIQSSMQQYCIYYYFYRTNSCFLSNCVKVENLSSIKHLSIIVQLILMIAILANGIIFRHTHRNFSGELITHALLYSLDSDSSDSAYPVDPRHSHSAQEFERIDLLSFSVCTSLIFLISKFIIFQVLIIRRFRIISLKDVNQFFQKNREEHPLSQ